MFDAEIADGEIGPITQAIQNALRGPTPVTVQRLASTAASKSAEQEANGIRAPDPDPDVDQDGAVIDAVPEASRQRQSRKPAPTPDIVPLEMNDDISLTSFAQGRDSKSHHKRFLIAAAWLKEHRNLDAVSVDHIYTCYRSMGWPTNIPDFAQPLRELKSKKFFTQPEKGRYAINHIGLDYVKKLGGE
jgi:hypothetical protein